MIHFARTASKQNHAFSVFNTAIVPQGSLNLEPSKGLFQSKWRVELQHMSPLHVCTTVSRTFFLSWIVNRESWQNCDCMVSYLTVCIWCVWWTGGGVGRCCVWMEEASVVSFSFSCCWPLSKWFTSRFETALTGLEEQVLEAFSHLPLSMVTHILTLTKTH